MFASILRQTGPSQVRNPLLRRAFLMALVPAVILAGRMAKSDVVRVPAADGGDWRIAITPAATQFVQASADEAPAAAPGEAAPAAPEAAAAPVEVPAPVAAPVAPEAAPQAAAADAGIMIVPNPIASPEAVAYAKIYNAIPFNRTEYLANPSYRHETAMELLTGNQRQIVVHRHYKPQLNQPIERQPQFFYNRYNNYGGGGFGYGYGGGYGFGSFFNNYSGLPPTFRYFLPIEDAY